MTSIYALDRLGELAHRHVFVLMNWKNKSAGSLWGPSLLSNSTLSTLLPQKSRQILIRQLGVFQQPLNHHNLTKKNWPMGIEVHLVFINAL